MGSYKGPERKLAQEAGIPFVGIVTGKLRRYFDVRNFFDLFRFPIGVIQAWGKLGRIQPDVVFSKGGFVAVPVVWAAWLRRIPVVIHESDAIPGLATRLSARFAQQILLAYERARIKKYRRKTKVVGNPIRSEILKGSAARGKKFTGFKGTKPVLLVMGGSTGSQEINNLVDKHLDELLATYDVLHITGDGKGKTKRSAHYVRVPYVNEEMKDVYAITRGCISRAGANSLAELEALKIPSLLFPLGTDASRGDQWVNAQELVKASALFKIADQKLPLVKQLVKLPKRPKSVQTSKAAESIATILLSYA